MENYYLKSKKCHRRVESLPTLKIQFNKRNSQLSSSKLNTLRSKQTSNISSLIMSKDNGIKKYIDNSIGMKTFYASLRVSKNNSQILDMNKLMKKVTNRFQSKQDFYPGIKQQSDEQSQNIERAVQVQKKFVIQSMPNFCYQSDFPYVRIGSCLVSSQNYLLLIGGAIRRKFYYANQPEKYRQILFHKYQLNKKRKWKHILNRSPNLNVNNLVGHTLEKVGKSHIAVIGGVLGDTIKTLYLFSTCIKLFDLQIGKFSEIQWRIKIRQHSSCCHKKYIIIHGGFDPTRKIRNQLYIVKVLNFQTANYNLLTLTTNQTLSSHKIISTVSKCKAVSRAKSKKLEGLYIFGGQDNLGNMDNKLKFYQIRDLNSFYQQNNCQIDFTELQMKGVAPEPRIHHSADLIQSKLWIIIIGGLNCKGQYLGDLWVGDLISMSWFKSQSKPSVRDTFGGICRHATTCIQEDIYIFGGQHKIDNGNNNLWNLKIDLSESNEQKYDSNNCNKISSFWSISSSKINIDQ